ncbi:MAG TPA: hypothetical protein VJ508_19030 [Saprospiraceae bacterium]|nr:hypothetical protein [Saprospiraceae bacterium]
MERRIIKILMVGMVFSTACYYDVAERLYPATACITTNMTYQGDIKPILETNCYVCHSAAANNGNVTLEGYPALKNYVDNGKLLGAIKHQSGFSPMPQNANPLSTCDQSKIEQWINDGALNN